MATLQVPGHVTLGVGETTIIGVLGGGVNQRVYLSFVNNDTVPRTIRVFRYDSDGAESAVQTTAILYDRTLQANSAEVVELSLSVGPGWTITALASAANVVICHTDTIQI